MDKINVSFLKGKENGSRCVSFGIPWKDGECTGKENFSLEDSSGKVFPAQNKANAFWADGSVKWSLISANLNGSTGEEFKVLINPQEMPAAKGMCSCTETSVEVDTGVIKAHFERSGNEVLSRIVKDGIVTCTGAKLAAVIENRSKNITVSHEYTGLIDKCEIEENGQLRSVVKISGSHYSAEKNRNIFPFTLRFYFFKDSDEIKISHTFIYNGDANEDFIKGLGIRFSVPMRGRSYNRHVKISGDNGFFHEALQLLTSWRPRLEPEIYTDQMEGKRIDFMYDSPDDASQIAIKDITTWDNYKIFQDSSEHFLIRKRTKSPCCTYIDAVHGKRAGGLAYIGNHRNGIAVGMSEFWRKYPSSIHMNNLTTDEAELTAWLWSPDFEAADMRHYDTVGHAGAYYEGFDEVRSTPYGIANTNELYLWSFTGGIAEDSMLSKCTETVNNPPVMVCSPQYYHDSGAFGVWGLPNRDTERGEWVEEQLDKAIDYYISEVEQRKWYGFFNYGDFMHTYDNVRNSWRYDMGGYAWQNTELVPTLWLWLAFIRSGKTEIYDLAYAMSKHTSEVDVYHMGEYQGLGSRHNVVHWGCSCKEARIAMAGHHRYLYYLTGDERIGDVFDEVSHAEYGVEALDPLRYFYEDNLKTHARTGPDWSSLCANWMTAWERRGDEVCRDKMLRGIEDIKKAPLKLASGSNFGFDPDTGEMIYIGESASGGSHLAICMGAPSIWMELADILKDEEWKDMIAQYGDFYFLPADEKVKRSGGLVSGKGWSFPYMASSMMAYYANRKGDKERAQAIWKILEDAWNSFGFNQQEVKNYPSAFVASEVTGISTNFMAQWCLNAIMCTGLI